MLEWVSVDAILSCPDVTIKGNQFSLSLDCVTYHWPYDLKGLLLHCSH